MSFANPNQPNQADYLLFLRNGVGIGPAYLPDNSMWITTTLNMAIAMVVTELQFADPTGTMYTLACYNFATDRLLNFAIDLPGQTYFQNARQTLGLNSFSAGLIIASSDQGTSQAMQAPDWAKSMTITDLQMMRTPYGRVYLDFAQSYGPNIWGLT